MQAAYTPRLHGVAGRTPRSHQLLAIACTFHWANVNAETLDTSFDGVAVCPAEAHFAIHHHLHLPAALRPVEDVPMADALRVGHCGLLVDRHREHRWAPKILS
jgi:hypothetical protein